MREVSGAAARACSPGATGEVLIEIDGDADYEQFGNSVDGAGDVDADGYGDVVVGAPYDGQNGFRAGRVLIVSGRTGQTLFQFLGDAEVDGLGWAVSGAGDVNGDGYADVIAGAPDDDDNGSQAGSARVLSLHDADGPGVAYCFGAGCPCSNPDPDAGCRNSTGQGASLASHGSNALALDDLWFTASQLPPKQLVMLVAALDADDAPFGGGLRCIAGAETRLGLRSSDAGGDADWGPGLAGTIGAEAGETRYFQAWYRDLDGPCGSGFNATQALAIVFLN